MPYLELLLSGILLGGVYALIACGLNLIFGVMRVINFANGDLLALGALLAVTLVLSFDLPYVVALFLVPLIAAAIGLAMHGLVIRNVIEGPMIMSLLATFALSMIVVNVSLLVWGGGFYGLPQVLSGSVSFLGQDVPLARLVSFLLAMFAALTIWWFLQKTRFGKAIRAVSQAPELAVVSGISIVRVGIKAFAVIIIGGMGSYPGAMVGALLIGVMEVFAGYMFGQVIGAACVFLAMLVVLIFRPSGIFGIGARA